MATLLGTPNSARSFYCRQAWSLIVFDGVLYVGAGNSSNTGVGAQNDGVNVKLWTYTPAGGFVNPYDPDDQQIEKFRVLNGVLTIPGHDPNATQDLGNLYRLLAGTTWTEVRTLPDAIHNYDLAIYGGRLIALLGDADNAIAFSDDDAVTWAAEPFPFDGQAEPMTPDWVHQNRAWGFLPVGDDLYINTEPLSFGDFTSFEFEVLGFACKEVGGHFVASTVDWGGTGDEQRMERALKFGAYTYYICGNTVNDHQWTPLTDGLRRIQTPAMTYAAVTLPASGRVQDLKVSDGLLYALVSSGSLHTFTIYVYSSPDGTTWTERCSFSADSFARSFAIDGVTAYIGLGADDDADATAQAASGTIYQQALNFDPPLTGSYFYGVFSDGGLQQNPVTYAATVANVRANAMNLIAHTTNTGDLDEADGLVRVIAAKHVPLYNDFYEDEGVAATIENARAVVYPLADALMTHASLLGYNIADDASAQTINLAKLALVLQAFTERDPAHPAAPVLVPVQAALEVSDLIDLPAYLMYRYPFRVNTAPLDMFLADFHKYWWHYLREGMQLRTEDEPLWVILQAHDTMVDEFDTDPIDLRPPTPNELAEQFWPALGEGATVLPWFNNETANNWVGIAEQPDHWQMAQRLGTALWALAPTLEISHKIPDRFTSTAGSYISTWRETADDSAYYVIACNSSADHALLEIDSAWFTGGLRDLLTGETFALGEGIPFTPGAGRMFAVTDLVALTPPSIGTNLVLNSGFETVSGGHPTEWGTADSSAGADEFHSGATSFKPDSDSISSVVSVLTLTPGETYYVWGYAKRSNLNGSDVGLQVYQATPPGAGILDQLNWEQTGSHEWRKFFGWFVAPDDLLTARAQLLWRLATGEQVWFDDLGVMLASEHTPEEYLSERLSAEQPAEGYVYLVIG